MKQMKATFIDRQDAYYAALAESDQASEATPFVRFMLQALLVAIDAAVLPTSAGVSVKVSGKTSGKILAAIQRNPTITIPELAARIGVAERTIERNLSTLQTAGHLRRVGPAKGGYWEALV